MFDLHGYLPLILEGLVVTIKLAAGSLVLAVAIGALGAIAKLSGSRSARAIASAYTTLIRGVPELVWMMIIFFGGQVLVNNLGYELAEFSEQYRLPVNLGWDYVDMSAFFVGTLTLSVIYGAYMTETFRGAILAVPRGEIEAGHAFGMSARQVFFRITLPASVRHALPGLGNNWMVLSKATALVSVIGLHDLVFNAAQAGGAVRQPFTFFLIAALFYLLITGVSDTVLRWLDRRYSAGVRRA